jgi:hypothetical protein
MKKIILSILFCGCLTFMSSCTDGFDEMNTTSTSITKSQVLPNSLLLKSMWKGVSANYQRNYNLYDDFYAHYFAEGLSWWITDYYEYRDDWARCGWEEYFTEREKEFIDVRDLCGDQEGYKDMKAINDIWNVVLTMRMVDRFGDIPYKDADGNYVTVKATTLPYNTQKEVYTDMLTRLESDAAAMTTAAGQYDPGADDLVYGGTSKITTWKKFAYSLMLRLAMRLSNVDSATAKSYASKAIAGGVFDSNADNARIQCDDSRWQDYYGRIVYDWNSAEMSDDLMQFVNGTKSGYQTNVVDPRRPMWFVPSHWTDKSATATHEYVGLPNGLPASDPRIANYDCNNYAKINIYNSNGFFYTNRDDITKSHLYYPLMDYSEVCFLKAEAALRGFISGDAETFYKEGITASISNVAKCSGVTTVTDADIATYIAALPSYAQASTKEAKFRLICMQEWLALFPNAQEGWSLFRRTGYPDNLTYPTGVSSNSLVEKGNWIQRISLPNSEYSNDADNVPTDYKSGAAKYAKREQYGLFWSQAGDGGTQSKTATPNNHF